jgi:hypothetical protein
MSQTVVKYRLLNPKSRPNPFIISPNVIFKDGICTLVIEHDTIDIVDRTLGNYGAERVKEKANGKSAVQTDGALGDGQTDQDSDDRTELGAETLGGVDGSEADEGLEGNSGSETPGADGQSTEVPAVEPAKRLTKEEKAAGLDLQQAAHFRLSESEDPAEWLAAHNAIPDFPVTNEDDLV